MVAQEQPEDEVEKAGNLTARGIGLRILSMGGAELNTQSPTSTLMLTLLAAVAQFERELMLERQRDGIRKAAKEGKYRGRAPTARRKAGIIIALRDEGVKPTEICERAGVTPSKSRSSRSTTSLRGSVEMALTKLWTGC